MKGHDFSRADKANQINRALAPEGSRLIRPRRLALPVLRFFQHRHSLREINALRERDKDHTIPNTPEAESIGAEFWKSARVAMPAGKTSLHLRLDNDVVEWFRAHGKGQLTRMNAVLRAYVEAQKRHLS